MRKFFALLLAFGLLGTTPALASEVEKAVGYGLMNGYSAGTFGYADPMTRAQFTAVLVRMMGWDTVTPQTPSYTDVPASHTWYGVIETAAAHDVADAGGAFRPSDPVTRGEMAELLVRALGLKGAAERLNDTSSTYSRIHSGTPFIDLPEGKAGYIAIAYRIGMTNGTSPTTFSPDNTATRAQAAAMLVRVHEKMHQLPDYVHGFYAISSYSQLHLAEEMDAVSAGWGRMTWDGETALLSTTSANGNEYAVPSGYQEVTAALESRDVLLHLSVFMDGQELKDLLASETGRTQAVEQIVHEVTVDYQVIGKNPYSGVTIDFEGLRSAQRADFTAFLTALDRELEALDKSLYVCVSPVLYTGSYYDGYDYAAISRLADKVILMAYDYDTRDLSQFVGSSYQQTAATVPLDQVYRALQALTEQVDPSQVLLGFSSKCTAWQIDEAGNLVSGTPVYPTVETVAARLAQPDTERGWSNAYQQSYAVYRTEDGSRWFLWYQDERSLQAELQTARLLGVTGVSFWRLGTLPTSADWNWSYLPG